MAAALPTGDLQYDLNCDQRTDQRDWRHLIQGILRTNFGDANLDGVFNSSDLVQVFKRASTKTTSRTTPPSPKATGTEMVTSPRPTW